ncbi:MAG: polysaccharide deacetylase family protein [Lachnospiraceae bacterium]
MEEQSQESFKRHRERKQRVKRMKKVILFIILGWSIFSMIAMAYMLVQIHSLNQKIDMVLNSKSQMIQQAQQKGEKSANLPEISESDLYDDTEENSSEDEISDESNILASSITLDEANLAKKGDALKVYLTFDDGPSKNTSRILDYLNQQNVKATFFVTAKEDESSVRSYQRIVNEGHTLALHSYTHDYKKVYASKNSFESDVTRLQDLLYDKTGIRSQFYRFPGGSSNQYCKSMIKDLTAVLEAHDLTYFDWNVANGDATGKTYSAGELTQNVLQDVPKYKTSIVLMHDTAEKDTTVESLKTLIPALKKMGAEILPIDKNTTVIQHVHAADAN